MFTVDDLSAYGDRVPPERRPEPRDAFALCRAALADDHEATAVILSNVDIVMLAALLGGMANRLGQAAYGDSWAGVLAEAATTGFLPEPPPRS